METQANKPKKAVAKKFKSYYVVWKHKKIHTGPFDQKSLNRTMQYGNPRRSPRISNIRCGSLNRTMQYGNTSIKAKRWPTLGFKSYYVVWKHDMVANKSISNFFGLNRTMQYGNFFISIISFSSTVLFKSYYVVWKQLYFKEGTSIRLV